MHCPTSAIKPCLTFSHQLLSVHPSKEVDGLDMDNPQCFASDSEGGTDGGNETYPETEVRCIAKSVLFYG